ncbi:hypothetical protein VTO42DRAFT_7018 [Malbranchea cinnamomea]
MFSFLPNFSRPPCCFESPGEHIIPMYLTTCQSPGATPCLICLEELTKVSMSLVASYFSLIRLLSITTTTCYPRLRHAVKLPCYIAETASAPRSVTIVV